MSSGRPSFFSFQSAFLKSLCNICCRQSFGDTRTLSPNWSMRILFAARRCQHTCRDAVMCPSRVSNFFLLLSSAHCFGSCSRPSLISELVEGYFSVSSFWSSASRLWLLLRMNVHSGLSGLWLSKERVLKSASSRRASSSTMLRAHIPWEAA